jgi:hypothetical protein
MSFCICTFPEIIVIISTLILAIRYWKYKSSRSIILLLIFIVFAITYFFYGYFGFLLFFIFWMILRKQRVYQKNRENLLKYFGR